MTYYWWKNQFIFYLPKWWQYIEICIRGYKWDQWSQIYGNVWCATYQIICLLGTIILNIHYNLIPLILEIKYHTVLFCIWSLIYLPVCIYVLVVCLYFCLVIYFVLLISFIKCNSSNMGETKIINQSINQSVTLSCIPLNTEISYVGYSRLKVDLIVLWLMERSPTNLSCIFWTVKGKTMYKILQKWGRNRRTGAKSLAATDKCMRSCVGT